MPPKPKRIGRPPLPASKVRGHHVRLRFTQAEYDKLLLHAKRSSMTITEYIHQNLGIRK